MGRAEIIRVFGIMCIAEPGLLPQDLQGLPEPEAPSVKCKRNEGGLYGVSVFGGNATIEKSLQQVQELR